MQPEILILSTSYDSLWETGNKASYKRPEHLKISDETLTSWEQRCPFPAIALYYDKGDFKQSHKPPSFLSIKNINYDQKGVDFDFEQISKLEELKSSTLKDKLKEKGIEGNGLVYAIDYNKFRLILENFNTNPPVAWEKLLGANPNIDEPWDSWIGKHFLRILSEVSDHDYEDITTHLFTSLGFEVRKMGYEKPGPNPDGIVFTRNLSHNFAIVYDCKNSKSYFPDKKDERAMKDYINKAKDDMAMEQIEKADVYFAYIAHSFEKGINIGEIQNEISTEGFLLTSEAMLGLLFWKLKLGRKFPLGNLRDLKSVGIIDFEVIDKKYNQH